jgi:hypothetical protein
MKSPLHKYTNSIRQMRDQGKTYTDIRLALAQDAGLFYTESNLRSFWMRHIKPMIDMQDVVV